MDKYDVGIFGLWYGNNYGSIVTYYALSKIIGSMGKTYAMIKNPLGANIDVSKLCNSHPLRFAAEHYTITPLYPLKDMSKHNDMFDAFLIGSDQMWNYFLSKNYKQSFFLDFANDDKTKIAYGCSFGHEGYDGPESEKELIKKNLARFNAVSVRDNFSQSMCRDIFGIRAALVYDPVFLCPIEHYESLIDNTRFNGNDEEEFIFAYILDPNPEIGKAINDIFVQAGKKIRVIFDQLSYNTPHDINDFYNLLGLSKSDNIEIIDDPNVNEWLYCFKNSDFVLSDSFHGCCFSIIFKKNFLVLRNMSRGGGRFDHLLSGLGLQQRIANSPQMMVYLFTDGIRQNSFQIDYQPVYEVLENKIAQSYDWLKTALETPKGEMKSVVLPTNNVQHKLDMKMCMGCSACVNTCPKGALELKPDEHGYYRSAIDYDKCIDCSLCTKVCPALNLPENNNSKAPELYEFIASKEDVLWKSSSGGVFPLLANETFKMGGVVVGAAWRDDFTVEHIMIDSADELYKLQKSKYLQSWLGNGIYTKIKEKLEQGVFVLFSGCPCQVTGLKSYLKKDYDNLILIDLLCGNAPSSMFFKKYIEEDFPVGLEKYEFRHKVQGRNWDCITINATANGVVNVRRGAKQDNYQHVYHNHTMCPPHCEKCKYQAVPRFGDITIGDFWGIENKDKANTTKNGTSAVLINNEKGKQFFFKVPVDEIYVRENVPLAWLGGNGYAINGSHNYCSPKRDLFYEAITTMSFSEAVAYALKPNHGIYPKASVFGYKPSDLHFSFDNNIWEERYINGVVMLTTKEKFPKPGNFCTLPLNQCLAVKKYKLRIKFKLFTEDTVMNFHIKDSGSRLYQVIYSHKVTSDNYGKWIEIEKEFTPDCDFYDEFMIGAAQLRGENRSIMIDYIRIEEI